MLSDSPRKVSVAMITYIHEEFISKAIDSVLMQRTNFYYEIVIREDCSTDNTRNIIIDYQKRYPDKFRLLLNKKESGRD
jgi:glycosyltransferase involved in cell wall biosynthesis